ncbi:cysteine desulfurase NifS [Salipaludibacillus neizhouensis]|uniref:cysteine desulfurase n=1 Tax=Salipaludibacillus neizhouensis TaxID=885475 RepID=A0A3A9KG91_9BACI|nr:cysteine desulfurase family protein [Salipaludibacillus neizhouensis]RKL68583.1 cysteine desulfurase NifS [Salipaludibacillus neizhouensis]
MERIYLDHAATSPMHPEVFQAMKPFFETYFGNPSSIHHFGREARRGLDEAREFIAQKINARFDEIVFTSGGTEADNLAILGYAFANNDKGNHLITTKIEHHAVLHAFQHLEKSGYSVTYLDVNEHGEISMEDLENALTDETILVSIMFGNNEVGSIQPIEEIGRVLAAHQTVFHTDAVQVFGSEQIDVNQLGVDLLAASGHKINGPNGTGFLYIRQGIHLASLQYGGEQERKRRSGTENVPAIVGMQKALELALKESERRKLLYTQFKEILLTSFEQEMINFKVNGNQEQALSHILNVSFPGLNVESILMNLDLDGVAVSSGSACTAGSIDPSHVLTSMFNDKNRSHSAVRFSFGLGNDLAQIEEAAQKVVNVMKRLESQIK